MDISGIIHQISHIFAHAKHVVLVPHRFPDADSLGSAVATHHILNSIHISNSIYCHTHIPKDVEFQIKNIPIATQIPHNTDVICVFDSGDAQFAHLSEIQSHISTKPIIINIDHHISNDMFGDINLVMPHMPSTTAILYTYIESTQTHITPEIADLLMAGLLNDTTIFSNPSTNQNAIHIGAQLIQAGADIPSLMYKLYCTKPIGTLKLWGRALSRIKKHPHLNIAHTVLTLKDHQECGVTFEQGSGLANFFNTVSDCAITLILRETEQGYIKGSLRTTYDNLDVTPLALALGGGGHKKAAGFTIPGTISQTENGWKITQ